MQYYKDSGHSSIRNLSHITEYIVDFVKTDEQKAKELQKCNDSIGLSRPEKGRIIRNE